MNTNMDMDTTINGLAHELWAMAQGVAPIEDVITPMMQELQNFATSLDLWQRDCRTCLNFRSRLHCDSLIACDNASQYKATHIVRLWDRRA